MNITKKEPSKTDIAYFCKDCKKLVDGKKIGRRQAFVCGECKSKNVAFGTEKSMVSYYHIKEEKEPREVKKVKEVVEIKKIVEVKKV